MKAAIAIRHLDFEDLGTLAPLLAARGYGIHYVDATRDELTDRALQAADLIVVLGGPIGAFDESLYPFLADELSLVRARLASGRPLIGICLGAQLIARALGADVRPMGHKEIGFGPLTLTEAGRDSALAALGETPVLHWHGDQFAIPAGTQRLAGTQSCPHQAFALGVRVLGLQFHLEADPRELERWLVGHACELGQAGIDPRTLRHAAQALQDALPAASQAVFTRWLDAAEAEPSQTMTHSSP
ncbi:MAG: glutamine amidotransferase [Burkholderiales bacterium]|uniref:Glutamine amidotransferase n=2 Tax=Ottowia pentelensis TaxID=511108 RepID=A0ABV6PT00_9BURK|nr:glutamine amidotransferase [Ottowia sp.]MBN9405984.1 glutamine amidotransferase [Burkholderiales bacterium]MBS0402976.1 glutamine amidotransferase [Pseudomonadota bacterium]MBS0414279.1 glutamine amidotransferase [Pseudomonadota bacterium]HMN58524.1 glutamine amidotransferase [Ottowia sp.]